jgi:hypothetical protein
MQLLAARFNTRQLDRLSAEGVRRQARRSRPSTPPARLSSEDGSRELPVYR